MDLWGKAEGGCGAGCFATLYTLIRLIAHGETKTCGQSAVSVPVKAVACGDVEFESLMNLEWGGYSFLIFCFSSRIDI